MIWYFIKFFEREEWADQFMDGLLYLNTLRGFKHMESLGSADRGDPREAVSIWLQPNDVLMTLKVPALRLETVITAKDLAAPIQASSTYHEQLHLLCLCALYTGDVKIEDGKIQNIESLEQQLRIDPKCFAMGKFAVMVPAVSFLEQLRGALGRQKIAATGKLVSYYDDAVFSGEIAASEIPFSKQKRFSYQREFRICVSTRMPKATALSLSIGDLSAICRKVPASQFQHFNKIKVSPIVGSA